MNKIKYVPMGLFAISAAKLLILSGNWSDVAILIVLGAAAALWEFKEFQKRQKEVEAHFKKQDEVILKLSQELVELRQAIGTVKLSQGIRSNNVGRG